MGVDWFTCSRCKEVFSDYFRRSCRVCDKYMCRDCECNECISLFDEISNKKEKLQNIINSIEPLKRKIIKLEKQYEKGERPLYEIDNIKYSDEEEFNLIVEDDENNSIDKCKYIEKYLKEANIDFKCDYVINIEGNFTQYKFQTFQDVGDELFEKVNELYD